MMRILSLPATVGQHLRSIDDRILITGGTGWLGMAALESLKQTFGPALAQRVKCFGSSRRTLRLLAGDEVVQHPLIDMASLERTPSILLHFSCLTQEKSAMMSLTDYVSANREISRLARDAADRAGADRVFFVSSGAVYRASAGAGTPEPMNPYGELKLEDEKLFLNYAGQSVARKVVTARLFNLSGPYINKLGSYALSSLIEQARGSNSIHINAGHSVVRSYTGVENLLAVAFSCLLDPRADRYICFDTAGDREIEIGGLARIVQAVVNPHAVITRAAQAPRAADRYVGDGTKYRELAIRHGVALHDLERQVADTASYLENAARSESPRH